MEKTDVENGRGLGAPSGDGKQPEDVWLCGVRSGDMEATRAFLMRYRSLALDTAEAELGDADGAMEAAREAMRDAVSRLRRGEQVDDMGKWLAALTRRYAGARRAARPAPGAQAEGGGARRGGKRRDAPRIFLICLLIALFVLLLWALIGIIGRNYPGNWPDIGYRWFNGHVFDMF